MECFVNEKRVDIDRSTVFASMAEVVIWISKEFVPQNEVVAEIYVDEHILSTMEKQQLINRPIHGVNKLHITTANPAALIRQGLNDVLEYVTRLIPGITAVASYYKKNRIQEAQALFTTTLEGVNSFASFVSMVERYIDIDYQNDRLRGRTIGGHYQELAVIAKDLSASQENEDWRRLAAVLEENLVPHFKVWSTMIPTMVAMVREEAA
jgi:hypothetical protein